MKRKFILRILFLITLFTITGCNGNKEFNHNNSERVKTNNNSVVLYFSATGTTKKLLKE